MAVPLAGHHTPEQCSSGSLARSVEAAWICLVDVLMWVVVKFEVDLEQAGFDTWTSCCPEVWTGFGPWVPRSLAAVGEMLAAAADHDLEMRFAALLKNYETLGCFAVHALPCTCLFEDSSAGHVKNCVTSGAFVVVELELDVVSEACFAEDPWGNPKLVEKMFAVALVWRSPAVEARAEQVLVAIQPPKVVAGTLVVE